MFYTLFFAFLLFIARPSFSDAGGWAATYGGAGSDRAHSIRQTSDGGYVVAGETRTFGDKEFPDLWVLRLKADGTVEWQRTYGGGRWDVARSVQQTCDGGYIVAGWTDSFSAGVRDWDFLVLKLRSDGTVEWQKTYGGEYDDGAYSIQQTRDGGYIVAGSTSSFGVGACDFWILKLRADGSLEWQKTYGGIDWDGADSIQQTSDGGCIVAGRTNSFGALFEEFSDTWVLKLRADGSVDWQKRYGGDYWENASSIQQTNDGGYVVAGWTTSFGRSFDAWILKLAPDGRVEWQKTYGGAGSDEASSIQQTSDGGYIVAGETESFGAGKGDFWVLKLRPDGSIGPSCDLVKVTNISRKDSSASVKSPRIIPFDSRAKLQCPTLQNQVTDILANILCPQATPGED